MSVTAEYEFHKIASCDAGGMHCTEITWADPMQESAGAQSDHVRGGAHCTESTWADPMQESACARSDGVGTVILSTLASAR